MKRLLLWILALVIAAAPAVAEVCRLDCARPDPPACPLHQKAPRPCAHDHAIAAADLTRAGVDTPRPVLGAVAAAPLNLTCPRAMIDLLAFEQQHAPPLRSPRTDVLRI